MVHELGHVLGLGDYADPDSDPSNNSDHFHDRAIDPLHDHFSVMTYAGDTPNCRTPGVITGRDLRDFYEAYQVGPLTEVTMHKAVTVSSTGRVRATFFWGSSGAQDLNHNAQCIVAQHKKNGVWETLNSTRVLTDKGKLIPHETIGIVRCR